MRQVRTLGLGIRSIKGGKIGDSNMKKLEEDFAKTVSFGKSDSTKSPDEIKKKFSI
jgi:hypothetical protein